LAVIVIAVAVYLVNWLYRRSSKEVSFVRTGLFGEKVVINGGRLRAADHPRRDPREHERPAACVTRAKRTR
jgi:hypothetical protein